MSDFDIAPDPHAAGLTTSLRGVDASGQPIDLPVVTEKPLTIYLNRQEIVTAMTLGDRPQQMAVGFLYNQNMLQHGDQITAIDYDEELSVVIVRTAHETNYEAKLQKKIRTSGCAQGTVFGDIMDRFDKVKLNPDMRISTRQLMHLSKAINTAPSLYLTAGAIHGCVLCTADKPLIYVEDIGRHNAVDKIAGYMFMDNIASEDKLFYTTGRLTSEMVIKTALMEIPILVSRSGFTAWGVELANDLGMTLIGRLRGKRFICLSGSERLIWDIENSDPESIDEAYKPGKK